MFLIDVDLEEDPAWLDRSTTSGPRLAPTSSTASSSRRKGALVRARDGAALLRDLQFDLLELPIPRNVITARLMTAAMSSQLIRHRDREVCLAGLWVITGFLQVAITVHKGLDRGHRPTESQAAGLVCERC